MSVDNKLLNISRCMSDIYTDWTRFIWYCFTMLNFNEVYMQTYTTCHCPIYKARLQQTLTDSADYALTCTIKLPVSSESPGNVPPVMIKYD